MARPRVADLVAFLLMRSLRLLSIALGLGIFASSGVAFAHDTGEPGASGKGGTETCTGCHGQNSPQPSIAATLPDTVTAGQSVSVSLTVTGTRMVTGFDGAFDVDAIVTPGSGARAGNSGSELVSSKTMGVSGTWTFTVKVPNRNGVLSLWVAAVSGNGDKTPDGDGAMTKVFTSTITGSDAGAGNTAPPADTTISGAVGATTAALDAGPPIIDPNPILPEGDPGCQSAPGHAPDLLWIAGVGAVVIGLGRRAKRRR